MGLAIWKPEDGGQIPGYAHYIIGQRIDSGSFGVVYEARDILGEDKANHDRSRIVAIKFLNISRFKSTNDEQRVINEFLAEGKLGIVVRCPSLGHTLDLLDLRGAANSVKRVSPDWPVALVMPLYRTTLAKLVEKTIRYDEATIERWTRELAAALAALHHKNLVHRDVKANNIMFDDPRRADDETVRKRTNDETVRNSTCVLTDLGTVATATAANPGKKPPPAVTRTLDDAHRDPAFYPLEGHGPPANQVVDPAMDIYAFGEMLRWFAKIADTDLPWLEDTARACQHSDPKQRPRAADLIHRLSRSWDRQAKILRNSANWCPEDHAYFVDRAWITNDEFENKFVPNCGNRGGIFAIVALPGLGKSALLTKWLEQTGHLLGYYYRLRDNQTDPAAMFHEISRQIKDAYKIETELPHHHVDSPLYLEELLDRVMQQENSPPRLLIFVDGLDEAAKPGDAVRLLPKRLPRNVFVITSTRPASDPKEDHVASLEAAGATIFELKPDNPHNINDVRRYLALRLPGEDASKVKVLAERCGGVFLLARLLADAINGTQMSIDEALDDSRDWSKLPVSERLFAYYRQSWERICRDRDEQALMALITLAELFSAAQSWLSEGQVYDLLRWYEKEILKRTECWWTTGRIRSILPSLTWFLHRHEKDNYYQIRHQSVRDFLTDHDGPVAPRGLREMHKSIGNYYSAQAHNGDWHQVEPYGRFFAVRHLLLADEKETVQAAIARLTDFSYLEAALGGDQLATTQLEQSP